MEDRPQAVRGTDPAGRAQNTGGEHRRCASRPVAREPEQGSGPSLVECHSHFAWPSVIGRGALAQLFEPPYTRSVRTVVWEERRSDPSPYPDHECARYVVRCPLVFPGRYRMRFVPALLFCAIFARAEDALSVRWEELTGGDFVKAIEKAQGTCVLPFGILEKHGPHLPLGTDLFNVRYASVHGAEQEYAIVFPEYYFGQIFEA